MNKQVIFNLAVSDLDRSKAFFASLGFHFKPQYSSDNTAYMVVVDDCIHAMLMTEAFFASLIDKPVASAHQAAGSLWAARGRVAALGPTATRAAVQP